DRSGRELVIDAGPEDVVVEADAGLVGGATEIGGRSQIDVEVFELARPVRGELLFDACTSGPADPRLRFGDRRADHRHRPPDRVVAVAVEPLRHQRRLRVEFDFADREAAGDVQQETRIGQPAGAAAEGRKPRKARVARGGSAEAEVGNADARQRIHRSAAFAGALDVGFKTQQPIRIDLPVVADLSAANAAVYVVPDVGGEYRVRVDGRI